jgi:hypothetical protein
MEGGILKLGKNVSCTFCWVNSSVGLSLSHVEIQFVNLMGNFAFAYRGTVTFEYVEVKNQQSNWVYTLVLSNSSLSFVAVQFLSCSFSNSKYSDTGSDSERGSALVYFKNVSSSGYVTLNMSSSSFVNCSFLQKYSGDGGSVRYESLNDSSGLIFCWFFIVSFFIFISFFFFF